MATDEVGRLSKKISALESSGFSPDEINEVLRRLGGVAPITTERIYGETISSWMMTYALPSIVVLGTGALFFLLTGGDDELPITNDEQCGNRSPATAFSSGEIVDLENIDRDTTADERTDFLPDNPDNLVARPFRNPANFSSENNFEQNHRADSFYGSASERWLKEARECLMPKSRMTPLDVMQHFPILTASYFPRKLSAAYCNEHNRC